MKEFKLILITGEPGSGKTTLSRYFSNAGFPVVHTSAIFKMALLKKLIVPPQSGNKFAPAEADDFIISAIRKMLMKAILEGQSQLVVETFPRTIDQFNKIGELIPNYLKEKGISVTPILVFLTAAEETRIERMQGRTADRRKFDADRGYNDVANNEMFSYVSELSFERKLEEKTADYDKSLNGMKFTVYDSTVNDPSFIVSDLKKLFDLKVERLAGAVNSAANGYHERSGYIGTVDCNKMLDRICEECEELREEIAKSGPNSEKSHFEFADILHFVFCLSDGLGIAPDCFLDAFQKKTEINQARLHFRATAENKHKIVNGDLLNGGFNDGQ